MTKRPLPGALCSAHPGVLSPGTALRPCLPRSLSVSCTRLTQFSQGEANHIANIKLEHGWPWHPRLPAVPCVMVNRRLGSDRLPCPAGKGLTQECFSIYTHLTPWFPVILHRRQQTRPVLTPPPHLHTYLPLASPPPQHPAPGPWRSCFSPQRTIFQTSS